MAYGYKGYYRKASAKGLRRPKRRGKTYGKKSVKKLYGRGKGRGAPRGMVRSGRKASGLRSQSLAPGDLPKSPAGLPLKIFDEELNGQHDVFKAGSSQSPLRLRPISAGLGIQQDNGFNKRISNVIHPKHLHIRGAVGWARSTAGSYLNGKMNVRMVVVVDTQPNGFLAASDNVFAGSATDAFSTRFYNYSYTRRFKILCDKRFTVPRQSSDTAMHVAVDEQVDLRGYPVYYYTSSTNGSDADIQKNNLIVFIGPDQREDSSTVTQTPGDHLWFYRLGFRTYFTD